MTAGQLELVDVHGRSLTELADIANREYTLAWEARDEAVAHALNCGAALIEAKRQVGHGNFLPWLDANFVGSQDKAERFMIVARNSARVRNLQPSSMRQVLRALNDGTGATFATTGFECYTPAEYVDAARDVLGDIDLDPASSPEANDTIRAACYYTADDDGLTQPWHGRVWLNPPYGRNLTADFVTKLVTEYQAGNVIAAIVVLNAYGFDAVWFRPLFAYPLCFTDHRIKFYGGGPTFGSLFAYLGPDEHRFAARFACYGHVMRLWP